MGDPRRMRNKYAGPFHPWNKSRIEEEKKLSQEYGLKNKQELWRVRSKLKDFTGQAKKLIAATSVQAEREKKQLVEKLFRLGLASQDAKLDRVLGLNVKDLLERRLQTQVVRKGLARTITQARQMIVHRHVIVGQKKIASPAYFVCRGEESLIQFVSTSSFVSPEHPERVVKK